MHNPRQKQVISGDPKGSSVLLLGNGRGYVGDMMVTGQLGARCLAAVGKVLELMAEMS